jgi:hypothetical protein
VTVPVSVVVGDTESSGTRNRPANKPLGKISAAGQPATSAVNLWPGNTANCQCGGFNNQDTGYGGLTTAPDATPSGGLVFEANPSSGVVPHFEYLYTDLGPGQQTLSFHFKADLDSWVYITSIVDGVTQRAFFNVGNGTVGTVPTGWVAQISSAGNGWYRASATFTVAGSAIYNGFGLAKGDQQALLPAECVALPDLE